MVDHRGPCAGQRVVVEHDLVALPFRIGEAPGPRHFSGEDGDHGYYAACAAVPGSGAFYRRRFELLELGATGDGGAYCLRAAQAQRDQWL